MPALESALALRPDGPGYFHDTPEELAAVGTDYILNESTGTRGQDSTSGQQSRLWSRQGALLATTEQLAWYR